MYPEQPQGGTPGYDPNQPPAWTGPPVPPGGPAPSAPPAPGTMWSYPQQATGYPQQAYPPPVSVPPGYPAGYPQPIPPRPGSRAFVALIAVSAVLAVGLIATAAVGLTQFNKLNGQVNTLTGQRDAQKQKQDAAAATLQQDLTAADLPGKLSKVRELDKAADTAFHQYESGTAKFGVLTKAIADCDDAVDAYNQAAAKFPAGMLTTKSLPETIDLSNADTDCGRAFTPDI